MAKKRVVREAVGKGTGASFAREAPRCVEKDEARETPQIFPSPKEISSNGLTIAEEVMTFGSAVRFIPGPKIPEPPKNFPPENNFSAQPTSSITLTSPPPVVSNVEPYNFSDCVTRNRSHYFMPDVLAALRQTEANISECAQLLGRTRSSVRDFIFANLEALNEYNEQRDILVDKAEQALFEVGLLGRDPATLRFICSTLGKDRGYTPKIEHTGADNKPLAFEVHFTAEPPKSTEQKQEDSIGQLLSDGISLDS